MILLFKQAFYNKKIWTILSWITNIFCFLQKISMYSKIISESSFLGKYISEILSENELKMSGNYLLDKNDM